VHARAAQLLLPRVHKRARANFCERMKNLQAVFKRSTAAASSAPIGSSGQTIATALAKATSNTTQPLQQQEMLFLLGASVREPPAMAAAWLDRIISLGKQAEAVLKMLTILHRLQAPHAHAHTFTPLLRPCPCFVSAAALPRLRGDAAVVLCAWSDVPGRAGAARRPLQGHGQRLAWRIN
jgi:hypothetical protein